MKNFKELRQNFRQSMGDELELMHNLNNEAFESSSEGEYWKMRSKKNHKKSQTCQKFKAIKGLKNARRRKSCHGDKFKGTKKWYGYDEKYFDYDAFEYVIMDNVTTLSQKNRVYCRCCRKYKFIFSSQKKADNFILYNAETIKRQNGYSPIRSYYCSACGGWHTTHQEKLTDEELAEMNSVEDQVYEGYLPEFGDIERDIVTESESETQTEAEAVESYFESEMLNNEEVEQQSTENAQAISEDDHKMQLFAEIESILQDQMAEFDKALEARDVKACKRLNARLRRIFGSFDIQCQQIAVFFERIDCMSQKIKDLEQQLKDEQNRVMTEIWNIQQIFRSQIELFTMKFGLGRYEECWNIYNHLSEAVNSISLDMRFLKEFKRKLKTMEARLEGCELVVRASA